MVNLRAPASVRKGVSITAKVQGARPIGRWENKTPEGGK